MRKIIAAFNCTLGGICDHTSLMPDEEIHQHYTDLLNSADAILYGRITYQLMEYWRPFLQHPSGNKEMDDFAIAIDRIPKIVFSRTMKSIDWNTATLAGKQPGELVTQLKKEKGKDILVGSRSMIISLLNLQLIDELQLTIQPIVAGEGLRLFEKLESMSQLTLLKTKTFSRSGSITFYYEPFKN